jgi:hypothetical protein
MFAFLGYFQNIFFIRFLEFPKNENNYDLPHFYQLRPICEIHLLNLLQKTQYQASLYQVAPQVSF